MKTYLNYGNYIGTELRLTRQDAESMSHCGDCSKDVLLCAKKPYIKKQLKLINKIQLAKELKEYGAWDETELLNHEENLIRWLWICANNITESSIYLQKSYI